MLAWGCCFHSPSIAYQLFKFKLFIFNFLSFYLLVLTTVYITAPNKIPAENSSDVASPKEGINMHLVIHEGKLTILISHLVAAGWLALSRIHWSVDWLTRFVFWSTIWWFADWFISCGICYVVVETNSLPSPCPCGYPLECDLCADNANKMCGLELKVIASLFLCQLYFKIIR